jgi:hypothetical protein
MHSLLINVDENLPKGEGAFLKIEDERVRAGCNFRRVCDRIFFHNFFGSLLKAACAGLTFPLKQDDFYISSII